jgi:hypothetical protein
VNAVSITHSNAPEMSVESTSARYTQGHKNVRNG